MKNMAVLLGTFLVCAQGWAVTQKAFDQKMKTYGYSYPSPEAAVMNSEPNSDVTKLILEQEGNRKVANTISEEWFESKMSPEFKQLRQAFLQIKTGDELDKKLSELDRTYSNLKENDAQFFAAQIIPLRALRGIIWRLKPLVGDQALAHTVLLTSVKNIFVGANLFFPTDQTVAMSEYMTRPFVEDGTSPWTHTGFACEAFAPSKEGGEGGLEAHVRSVVIPMLETSADRISRIKFSAGWRVFDNRLWYGGNTFPDAVDRYALIGEVERYTALSNIYSSISTLSFEAAYSWMDFLPLNLRLAKLYGYNAMRFEVDGVPLKKRVAVLNEHQFAGWGVRTNPEFSVKAWTNLKNSVIAADNAWVGMKGRPVSEYNLVDNSRALPFQRPVNMRMQGMRSMINGESTVVSAVTREPIQVNLPAFFTNPPSNLRELYATGFVEGEQFIPIKLQTTAGPSNFTYRNYAIGSGAHWDIGEKSAYRRLFPNLKNDDDLKRHLRVLSQGWGSGILVTPLADYFY